MQGIYQILNTINGKRYIGSSVDVRSRWYNHKRLLEQGQHHSIHLQNSYNLYGSDNFEFSLIEKVESREELLDVEQWYLDNWDCVYNVATCTKSSMRGRNHSELALALISEANRGENNPRSKATEEQVQLAREMYATGEYAYWEIIDELDLEVTEETLGSAITGKSWANVGGPILGKDYRFERGADVIEIRELCATQEYTDAEIGKMYNKASATISHIARDIMYPNIGGPVRGVDYGIIKNYDEMEEETRKIRIMAYEGVHTSKEIAEIFGTSRRVVDRIVSGKRREKYSGPIRGKDYTYSLALEKEIINIREMCAKGADNKAVGKEYNRSERNVWAIASGRTFPDIGGPVRGVDYDREEDILRGIQRIREDYASGKYTMEELGEMNNKSDSAISAIVRGCVYKDVPGPIKGVDYGE